MSLMNYSSVESTLRQRIEDLQKQNDALQDSLRTAQWNDEKLKEATAAIASLRKQLSPLYRALQMVFGDTSAFADAESSSGQTPDRHAAVWANWKAKLGPSSAKVIDALLMHGEMNVTQLKIACGMAQQTVYDQTSKLGRAGLINKNGGRFSLKELP